MKNIVIIIFLLAFGCEELEEQTSPLSGIFYVFEGWESFMSQDYDRAKELFSATLLADEGSDINYYDYAYTGLGWTAMYKANINQGLDNKTLRDNLRLESIDSFESAKQILDAKIVSDNMQKEDTLLYANVLAGIVFHTSYLAADKAIEFYDTQNNSIWTEALALCDDVFSKSDILISTFPQYDFEYDSDLNIDHILAVRVVCNLRKNNLSDAKLEAELITDMDCGLTHSSIRQCLTLSGFE